jgi:hypothetical protein
MCVLVCVCVCACVRARVRTCVYDYVYARVWGVGSGIEVSLVITFSTQTPIHHIRGGWSHYADISESVAVFGWSLTRVLN